MEQHHREKRISSASEIISRILWNLKIHYQVHNSLLLVPVLRQIIQCTLCHAIS